MFDNVLWSGKFFLIVPGEVISEYLNPSVVLYVDD